MTRVSDLDVILASASPRRRDLLTLVGIQHSVRPADVDESLRFDELPVTASHAARVAALPDVHKDPFDRLLVAQALAESAVLLTNDAQLKAYGAHVRVIA